MMQPGGGTPDGTATVIVGGGQAGSELAFELRRLRHDGPIVLLCEEPHLPYHRPPLSKAALAGEIQDASILLRPASSYEKAEIAVRLGATAVRIDRSARAVELEGGERLPYRKLALATGGTARRMRVPGHDLDGIHYLRRLDEAAVLRAAMQPGQRLVVVGGGYVGLEVAAAARSRGMEVTVLESMDRVLARVAPPEISAFYESVHRGEGTRIQTGTTVLGFEGEGRVRQVACSGGDVLPADLVVVGIGLVPNVSLAEDCGLPIDDGIVIDAAGRTADPDIVAAGDCTRFHSAFLERWVRLESVPNAIEQAKTAAATLCGMERPYTAAPWFWSDQYSLKLQMVGAAADYDAAVLRGSFAGRSFSHFYLKGGVVVGADTVNRPGEFMICRKLVEARARIPPALLGDDMHPLRGLL